MTTHYLLITDALVPPALDGRKTQTRRVLAWSNSYVDGAISKYWRENWEHLDFSRAWADKGPSPAGNPGPYLHVPVDPDFGDTTHRVYPRYAVGDRVIFKETCCAIPNGPDTYGIYEKPDLLYRADGDILPKGRKWRSSMLMPSWAARLICTITEVRMQQLQEITEEDAKAEGIDVFKLPVFFDTWQIPGYSPIPSRRVAFSSLWDNINEARGYSWESNPYVYAITFRRDPCAS